VALVDRGELTKASGNHIVAHQSKHYSCESKEAAEKFMRRPMRYVQKAKLPGRRPAVKGEHTVSLLNALAHGREAGRDLEPSDMLTYMQASVAEVICQALVDSGDKRPLFPGTSPQESALLFLARFLRAKNSINTEMQAARAHEQFEEFLGACAMPQRMGEAAKLKEAREAEGTWTSSDARMYKEVCAKFDDAFASRAA